MPVAVRAQIVTLPMVPVENFTIESGIAITQFVLFSTLPSRIVVVISPSLVSYLNAQQPI